MNNKKMEFRFFSVPEWEKEQAYLRKKHNMGWKLVDVKVPGVYHFEACSPEDVSYQLDYNQEGIAHKDEYVQMFKDCGWEYLLDYAGYSYFRKPILEIEEKETIFCDDDSRMEMIKRVYKGKIIPLLVIFFAVIIPQLFIQIQSTNYVGKTFSYLFLGLFSIYLITFLQFGIYYWRLRNKPRI